MNLAGWFCRDAGWGATVKHANPPGYRFSLFAEASASFKLLFGFGHKHTGPNGMFIAACPKRSAPPD